MACACDNLATLSRCKCCTILSSRSSHSHARPLLRGSIPAPSRAPVRLRLGVSRILLPDHVSAHPADLTPHETRIFWLRSGSGVRTPLLLAPFRLFFLPISRSSCSYSVRSLAASCVNRSFSARHLAISASASVRSAPSGFAFRSSLAFSTSRFCLENIKVLYTIDYSIKFLDKYTRNLLAVVC